MNITLQCPGCGRPIDVEYVAPGSVARIPLHTREDRVGRYFPPPSNPMINRVLPPREYVARWPCPASGAEVMHNGMLDEQRIGK